MENEVWVDFDPNVRVGHHQTYVGFEDILTGRVEDLRIGSVVHVVELESGLGGAGVVTAIVKSVQLIYIELDWSQIRSETEMEQEVGKWRTYGPMKILYLLKSRGERDEQNRLRIEIQLRDGDMAWDPDNHDWVFGPRTLVYARAGHDAPVIVD